MHTPSEFGRSLARIDIDIGKNAFDLVVPELLAGRTAIEILVAEIDEVPLVEPARVSACLCSSRGSQT